VNGIEKDDKERKKEEVPEQDACPECGGVLSDDDMCTVCGFFDTDRNRRLTE
jgi:ribosomal protein L37E